MTLFSVSSCSTGAVLGLMVTTPVVAANKISKLAVPIIEKLPIPLQLPATRAFQITVITGARCALGYAFSIPVATALTMSLVISVLSLAINKLDNSHKPQMMRK